MLAWILSGFAVVVALTALLGVVESLREREGGAAWRIGVFGLVTGLVFVWLALWAPVVRTSGCMRRPLQGQPGRSTTGGHGGRGSNRLGRATGAHRGAPLRSRGCRVGNRSWEADTCSSVGAGPCARPTMCPDDYRSR